MAPIIEDSSNKRARDHIATLALSLYQLHRLPAPGPDELGDIVFRAEASMSLHQLRHPENISAAAIGQIDQFVLTAAEARKRPYNIHSAEAAQLALAGDGKLGHKGMDAAERARLAASSARYNDLPAGEGSGGSHAGERGLAGVPAEFARAFAGSGVGRDTIKTFAVVGLDRGTFDQFRHEGFSAGQIVDNAKDMKVLGGHGREDLSIGQHAPTDLRKAAVAVDQEKDPAKKEQKRQREAQVAERYEVLPDSDKRKKGAKDFINWLEKRGHHIEHNHDKGLGASQQDGTLRAEHPHAGAGITHAEDKDLASFKKQEVAALSDKAANAFELEAAPAPAKPAPVRAAEAKRPAGPKPT